VQIPVAIFLHQHCPRGDEGGIGHDKEREVGIGVTEDRVFEKRLLQFQEGGFAVQKPLPSSIFLRQREEGLDDVGEVRDM